MATTRRPFSKDDLDPPDKNSRRHTKSSFNWSTVRESKSAKHIRVSIVVPTFQRPDLLDRCLEALVNQRINPETFEIIVVDDGASRETRAVVAQWTSRVLGHGPIIGYIGVTKGPHGPAAARNHGWRAANGDIIAFTDDDTVPDANWLKNSLQAFKGKIHAAWGRIVMPLPEQAGTNSRKSVVATALILAVGAGGVWREPSLERGDQFPRRPQSRDRDDPPSRRHPHRLHRRLVDLRHERR